MCCLKQAEVGSNYFRSFSDRERLILLILLIITKLRSVEKSLVKRAMICQKNSTRNKRVRRSCPLGYGRRDADDACAKITNDFILVSVAALDNG